MKEKNAPESDEKNVKSASAEKNAENKDIKDIKDKAASETAPDAGAASEKDAGEKKTASAEDWTKPPTLEEKLAAAEKKVAETEKMRLFALAEMDNQRKRFAKELEALRYRTTQDTLFPFLQVLDHFSMAVNASSAKGATLDTMLQGMKMIETEFTRAFQDLGVEQIDATGKKFDPKYHEAVSQEPSDTVPAGNVIRQWSMGCRMGDRLLKPAMVVVSSGPAAKGEDKEKSK